MTLFKRTTAVAAAILFLQATGEILQSLLPSSPPFQETQQTMISLIACQLIATFQSTPISHQRVFEATKCTRYVRCAWHTRKPRLSLQFHPVPGGILDHSISDPRRSIGFQERITYQPRYPSTNKPAHARKWLPMEQATRIGFTSRTYQSSSDSASSGTVRALEAPSVKTTQDKGQVGVSIKGGALSTLSLKRQRSLISRGRQTICFNSCNDKSPKVFAAPLATRPKAKGSNQCKRP